MAVRAHLHKGWGMITFLPVQELHCRTNFLNIADLHNMNVPTTLSPRYHFYDTLLSLSAGCDYARVPEETFWWAAYPYLPLCALRVSLHFHQNLCEFKISK